MNRSFQCLLMLLTLLCQTTAADMLVLRDQSEPVFGLIDSEDDSVIRFAEFQQSDQSFTSREFNRQDVKSIVQTIDPDRLEKLSIDRLEDYRNYAEELHAFRADPVARQLAIRLVLVSMYHARKTNGNQELCISAASNLRQLARDDRERQRFELVARLYGRPADVAPQISDRTSDLQANSENILRFVQALRRERFDLAGGYLETLSQNDLLHCVSLSEEDLQTAVLTREMDAGLRLKLLRTELAIRDGLAHQRDTSDDSSGSEFAESNSRKPQNIGWIPRLCDLTEFDLEATQFRNGRWERPEK